jgi:hypothetical protein
VRISGCALEHGSLIGAAELAWQPVLDAPACSPGAVSPERSPAALASPATDVDAS